MREVGEEATELEPIIQEKQEEVGEDIFWIGVRQLWLRTIDLNWMQHLSHMQHARSAVGLRAYGQRDPLVEYKQEGKQLYEAMRERIMSHLIQVVKNVNAQANLPQRSTVSPGNMRFQHNKVNQFGGVAKVQNEIIQKRQEESETSSDAPAVDKSIGRNDPCPCGSGKKYKKCGLINAPEHKG